MSRRAVLTLAASVLLPAAALLGTGCVTGGGALTVWAVDDMSEAQTDRPGAPDSSVYSAAERQVRLDAAINETVAFQLGIAAAAPPGAPIELRISDFTGRNGTIPAGAAAVFVEQQTRVERFRSWYPEHTGRQAVPRLVADALVPWSAPRGGGPLSLVEGRAAVLWVDVHVPPTTEPGEYRAEFQLIPRGAAQALFTGSIRLRVLSVALPARHALPVICRVDPRDLLTFSLHWPREAAETTRVLPSVASHAPGQRLLNETMRLFQSHATAPVLWASFPRYTPSGTREVMIDWSDYDALVGGWVDGSAFDDRAPLPCWPVPVSLEYPNAVQNGGLGSPRHARLLAGYLEACRKHFSDRGWGERAFLRPAGPAPLSADAVERVRKLAGVVRQSETNLPLVAHLPPQSLRGLGWYNAPAIDVQDVAIWAPRAMWWEPAALRHERDLGRRAWLLPDDPPYSGSLAVAAPPNDIRTLPWLAYRYEADAVWIEHAAEFDPAVRPGDEPFEPGLVYSGAPYGLAETPIPTIRLKRLRRGVQDVDLLDLLVRAGRERLAQSLAQQLIRWGCTDAAIDNILTTRPAGWPLEAEIPALARRLALQELTNAFAPASAGSAEQLNNLSSWGVFLNQAERVRVSADGTTLALASDGFRAQALVSVANSSNRSLSGEWTLPQPPPTWTVASPLPLTAPAAGRRSGWLNIHISALAYNTDGIYPFLLDFDTEALGAFNAPSRLAVAACPLVAGGPRVDGDLTDWALASSNVAGDFRLVRGESGPGLPPDGAFPTSATRCFFCMDAQNLYVGMQCGLPRGERPLVAMDNEAPIDGAIPWGQDVVEVLLDPAHNPDGGTSALYVLQCKPNGVLVSRRGARTVPPLGPSDEWRSRGVFKVLMRSDGWTAELAIPLDALGPDVLKNRVWGLNVTRLDSRRGEYSSWSGARGNCYLPYSMGNLVLLLP